MISAAGAWFCACNEGLKIKLCFLAGLEICHLVATKEADAMALNGSSGCVENVGSSEVSHFARRARPKC